jgi:hypothetical protein
MSLCAPASAAACLAAMLRHIKGESQGARKDEVMDLEKSGMVFDSLSLIRYLRLPIPHLLSEVYFDQAEFKLHPPSTIHHRITAHLPFPLAC